ncbi:MAG: VWA domain-containing protein [Bacillota bacterium]
MGLGPPLGQVPWHEKLRRVLARNRGARLGEAAVVSRRLHVSEQSAPQAITILTDVDFGQAAYGRERPGDVIHIDIFHAIAEVDHHRLGAAVREALAGVPGPAGEGSSGLLADYFDLGTATGGGRVTSAMDRMKKLSVRIAHRNHVHIAGLLPDQHLPVLWKLVEAVERAILAQGVELRRIERLSHRRGGVGSSEQSDLSRYYGDDLDSLIRGGRRHPEREGVADGQSLRGGRSAAGGARAGAAQGGAGGWGDPVPGEAGGAPAPDGAHPAPGGSGSGGGEGAGPGERPGPEGAGASLAGEHRLQTALDLSRKLGSPDEVKRVLEELAREQGWASLYQGGGNQAPFVMRQLEEAGLIRKEVRGMRLTDPGRELLAFLNRHMRDVKLRFRKLIRRIPGSPRSRPASRTRPGRGAPSPDVRYGLIRGTAPAEPGAWLGDLAVPETVRAAIRRTHLERIAGGGGPAGGLRLERKDVHLHLRAAEHSLHICLLIDASASMAGRRILAAKHLARHLLVSTRDKIAVIAFQEREVRVYVPFTRDYGLVEEGLSRIQPMGLTPLAHGLTQSMELIRSSRVRRPLLLLITDGIPTVPKWSIDPLADALEAARQVKAGRIPFGCIGLQPSKRYLDQLAHQAGGTLHVVEELSEESLVTIAHQERLKLGPKAR